MKPIRTILIEQFDYGFSISENGARMEYAVTELTFRDMLLKLFKFHPVEKKEQKSIDI